MHREREEKIWTIDKFVSQRSIVVDVSRKYHKKEKKIKPKIFAPYSRHFRILKNDIRKSYAPMIANILNSSDFVLIRKFFETFGVPGVNLDFCHDPCGTYDQHYRVNGDFNAKFTGADLMACIVGAFPNSAPDYTFEIKDAQIRIRNDTEGSIVTANYISHATYVYDFNLNEITKEIFRSFAPEKYKDKNPSIVEYEDELPHKRPKWEDGTETETETETETDSDNEYKESGFDSFVRKMNELSLKQNYATPSHLPFEFAVQGQLIIRLDERQRIENVTFTRLCCTTTTLSHDDL